jgi:putative hydrolase of the HAD superfamily
MTDQHNELIIRTIRELNAPLYPVPAGIEPELRPLNEIKVVVFDVYGTLFISECGDIGLLSIARSVAALSETFSYLDMAVDCSAAAERGVVLLRQTIAQHHAQRTGVDYPEVNIDDVWIEVLEGLCRENLIHELNDFDQRLTLMIRYEFKVNPVWQMPGLTDVLENLLNKNIILGIISNAQFFSPYIFQALLEKSVRDSGFNDRLCIWSYQYLAAKPSPELFSIFMTRLRDEAGDYDPGQILFVGNDMKNDILPAANSGMKTALFAGDKRSLRLREGDTLCRGIRADVVLTDLRQLMKVV